MQTWCVFRHWCRSFINVACSKWCSKLIWQKPPWCSGRESIHRFRDLSHGWFWTDMCTQKIYCMYLKSRDTYINHSCGYKGHLFFSYFPIFPMCFHVAPWFHPARTSSLSRQDELIENRTFWAGHSFRRVILRDPPIFWHLSSRMWICVVYISLYIHIIVNYIIFIQTDPS